MSVVSVWPPTIGVEEEFLLVDPGSGVPVAMNEVVRRVAAGQGVALQRELSRCQIEVATGIVSSSAQLRDQLRDLRRCVVGAAASVGVGVLAAGVPVTEPGGVAVTDSVRYRRIADRFGMLTRDHGICGCHVHVAVPDRDAAIQVSNHVRPWLPLLLALTANSAVHRGVETGFASWRSVLWRLWPTSGPPPFFESTADFDAMVAVLRAGGAVLEDGTVYWDVRPSTRYPTVEIRVSDVPATVEETVLLATLIRAAVMTGLAHARAGRAAPRVPEQMLRAAYWTAAHDGVAGAAVDPVDGRVVAIGLLVERFLAYARAALVELGEADAVAEALARVLADGNGAARQIRALRRRGLICDVVAELLEATQR